MKRVGVSLNVIRLTGLTVRFGRTEVLKGLDLSVRKGDIHGLLGRNGVGKTTAMRVLLGLLPADGGEVEVLGQTVKRVGVELKRRIGYVAQEPVFYGWMTADDLGGFVRGFYPRWDAALYPRLLAALDVPRDRRSDALSGGTRAKLALALALAPRPELLLLDEPTAGLDPVARREFHDRVSAVVAEGETTVLFSSHLVDEVERLARSVTLVADGAAAWTGAVADLLAEVRGHDGELPAPFVRLRGDVWRGPAAAWEGVASRALSLEDVFVAFARRDEPGA